FSGVIQLDAPASSLAPHREGHHCGPTGVIIWAQALTPPVPVKTIATTSALRSVREFIMVMPPMLCSPRPFVEPPRPHIHRVQSPQVPSPHLIPPLSVSTDPATSYHLPSPPSPSY